MKEMRIALRNAGKIDPDSIDSYIAAGGYAALAKARKSDPAEIMSDIEKTGILRGRGGAGFSTGFKWNSCASVESETHYIVCNCDEGEPGTFKDRTIIENDPHTLIEGILIGAYCIGAEKAFIYVRGEYGNIIKLLENAVKQAEEKGLTDGVSIDVIYGGGSYVCGEETALLSSLEGKRAEPRLKPPYPTVAGYLGKPTVVNNVETFAMVPYIVENGGAWFGSIGCSSYPGTKVFSLSGNVVNRGCCEFPTDATLRDVVEGFGGGVPAGRKLKAVQLGGSSCGYLTPDQLDLNVDIDTMSKAGAALGSGATLVIDDSHNIVDQLVLIAEFMNHESCGKCVPCREGTYRICELLHKINAGEGAEKDIEELKELSDYMSAFAFCPLGQGATTALRSALEKFPEDFQDKLSAGKEA